MTAVQRIRIRRWLLPLSGIGCALLLWEAAVRLGFIRSLFLPSPSAVFIALSKNFEYLVFSAVITMRDIAVGYLAGCSAGVALGILIGYYRSLNLAVSPILLILSPIPIVTFLPLFIIWFGLNQLPILACAFIAAFFPSLMSTISGVKNVDNTWIEVTRNFGATNSQILRTV